jgi:hypothetical protein
VFGVCLGSAQEEKFRYTIFMSLRNIFIGIGAAIALLPYLGFPSWFDTIVYTTSGLIIVFSLTIWKRVKTEQKSDEKADEVSVTKNEPKTLRVKRRDAGGSPVRVEKETLTGGQP